MFPYKWFLKNGYPSKGIEAHNLKVFSCFCCGGGSSMGYKLAGYDVLGGNEIDSRISEIYKENHRPRIFYNCDIRTFLDKIRNNKVEKELFNLDILDGSPPCAVFSMAGQREKNWGKEKKFREGQKKQILDSLFFDFINVAKLLKPKVIVAENVKGMLMGLAKGYVLEIKKRITELNYNVQVFLLNSATMGVPQQRERVFFIGIRSDCFIKPLNLFFNKKPILYKEIRENLKDFKPITPLFLQYWNIAKMGKSVGTFKAQKKEHINRVCSTIAAGHVHYDCFQPREMTNKEVVLASTFPLDYNFGKTSPQYLCGMSVPPVMIASLALEIYKQIFALQKK